MKSANKKDPVVTLKNFKHAEFASQETTCFEAIVCVDGKVFCSASDDGHGGEVDLHPISGSRTDLSKMILEVGRRYNPNCVAMYDGKFKFEAGDFDTWKERYAKKLRESKGVTASEVLIHLVNEQVTRQLYAKDLKKLMVKKVVYLDGDNIYNTKNAGNAAHRDMWIPQVKEKYPAAIVLNEMAFDDALTLFISKVETA